MDFITAKAVLLPAKLKVPEVFKSALLSPSVVLIGNKAQSLTATRGLFNALWIVDMLTQHLIAAANAQHFSAVAQVTENVLFPALLAQKIQVPSYVFAAGQNNQSAAGSDLPGPAKVKSISGWSLSGSKSV